MKNNKMEVKEIVLDAMKKDGTPLNAGKIVELTGLDRKIVDKAMTQLKNEGQIVSPTRCYWLPK
jgi:predicted transcriptional regulator